MNDANVYQIYPEQIDELRDMIVKMSGVLEGQDMNVVMVSLNTIVVSTIVTHIPEQYQRYSAQTFINSFMIAMAQAGINLYDYDERTVN
jgi:hypothetical protein